MQDKNKDASPVKAKLGKKIEVKPPGMTTRGSSRRLGNALVDTGTGVDGTTDDKIADGQNADSEKPGDSNEITIEIEIEKGKANDEGEKEDELGNDKEAQSVLKEDHRGNHARKCRSFAKVCQNRRIL